MTRILSVITSALGSPCRSRELVGTVRNIVTVLAIGIALYHLWVFTIGTFDTFLHRSIHVGTILAICFLTYSYSNKPTKLPIVDLILALLSLGITTYLLINGRFLVWERVALFPGSLTPWEIAMGVVLILMILEAGRRAMGSILPLIVLCALLYAYFGRYISGMFQHSGYSLEQIIDFTIFSLQGLYTLPIAVCSTYIILFLIFGGLVLHSGAGTFFTDLAMAVAGKTRGGAAKVAVIGSTLFGSVSSSATANVVVTGSVSIPMMKRGGFKPYFAGAVEATASTGGHIMPPIMGGSVFLMMEFIGMPYWEIVIIAFIPALLYFLGIFVQVHFVAIKEGISAIDPNVIKVPSLRDTLRKGWYWFLPFLCIIGLLAYGYSPIRAALWSMPMMILVSWFSKEGRIGIKQLFKALESSVSMIRVIMLATGLAGILMGVVYYTGAASTLMTIIRSLTSDLLLPALFLAAVFCLFMGLSLSGVAAYLLTAVLVVPATVSLGVPPVAAHLFAIYYASVANITPPTGGTFFLVASMAGAPPYKTGWQATKLAFAAFIVPFVFVYRPALLLIGNPAEIVVAVSVAVVAVVVTALVIEGYFMGKLRIVERLFLTLGVFGLVFGKEFGPEIYYALAGIGLIIVILLLHWLRAKRSAGGAKAAKF